LDAEKLHASPLRFIGALRYSLMIWMPGDLPKGAISLSLEPLEF